MESYLVDEAILGEFVDALIKEKYPNDPADAHTDIRGEAIKNLDFQILKAIITRLTKEQGAELAKLAEKDDTEPAAFEEFFNRCHIDIETVLKDTMANFKDEFLKGGVNG